MAKLVAQKNSALAKLQETIQKKDRELANWRRKFSRLQKSYRQLLRDLEAEGWEVTYEDDEIDDDDDDDDERRGVDENED